MDHPVLTLYYDYILLGNNLRCDSLDEKSRPYPSLQLEPARSDSHPISISASTAANVLALVIHPAARIRTVTICVAAFLTYDASRPLSLSWKQ